MNPTLLPPAKYRSIFISDVHLGSRGCQADKLLHFLRHTESENLFLVGDMVDGWKLKKGWFWPADHNTVVQKLLKKARHGTKITFLPGNHDEFARHYLGHHFGGIFVSNEVTHTLANGKKMLIVHGDEFDVVVLYAKWLAYVGDVAYSLALSLNHWYNLVRKKMGLPYWSLSAFLKHKVKDAVKFIGEYETALTDLARKRGVNGIICGHIHQAELKDMGGILYANSGDWVETCSALVEHFDGQLELLYWTQAQTLTPETTQESDDIQAAA